MRHTIKSELLQATLNYLATKPYNEVHEIIAAIVADAKPVKSQPVENSVQQESQS